MTPITSEAYLDALIADAMPTTSLFDRLKAECEAFEAKYPMSFPYKLIPKEELQEQRDRERKMFTLKPIADQQAILDINNDTIGHKPAVSSLVSFDGRAIVKEAA